MAQRHSRRRRRRAEVQQRCRQRCSRGAGSGAGRGARTSTALAQMTSESVRIRSSSSACRALSASVPSRLGFAGASSPSSGAVEHASDMMDGVFAKQGVRSMSGRAPRRRVGEVCALLRGRHTAYDLCFDGIRVVPGAIQPPPRLPRGTRARYGTIQSLSQWSWHASVVICMRAQTSCDVGTRASHLTQVIARSHATPHSSLWVTA